MSTLTIRLPDDQLERLRALALHRGLSLDEMFEEFAIKALTEFDVETRIRARAAAWNPSAALELLDKLDARIG